MQWLKSIIELMFLLSAVCFVLPIFIYGAARVIGG